MVVLWFQTSYSLLGKPRKHLSHCRGAGHKHRCLDNDEEAVQSQCRPGRCALRDGFVTILISVARFIEKRSKTPVGATTIGSFRLEYEYGIEYFPKRE